MLVSCLNVLFCDTKRMNKWHDLFINKCWMNYTFNWYFFHILFYIETTNHLHFFFIFEWISDVYFIKEFYFISTSCSIEIFRLLWNMFFLLFISVLSRACCFFFSFSVFFCLCKNDLVTYVGSVFARMCVLNTEFLLEYLCSLVGMRL